MRVTDDGYSTTYNAAYLRDKSRDAVAAWNFLREEFNADCILVRGHSGMSMAHAMLMLEDFPLVHLRKPGDNSHGAALEGTLYHNMNRCIILDDFVSTGSTVDGMLQTLRSLAEARETDTPEVVAVLQYRRNNLLKVDGEIRGIPIYGSNN